MTEQEIFTAIVKARGIDDVESFISPAYDSLGDPYKLPDMKKAVGRIEKAINGSETIAVYGDYDVDGLTATTVLNDAFRGAGAKIINFIPDRFIDGYGMSKKGVDELKNKGASLIITVDTGSLAHEAIEYAKKQKIDVIVTDHHNLGETLPNAVAVINPKRADSKYPANDLAGVGVAFGLVRALQSTKFGLPDGQEKWLLDLVALGTVCDIVPLLGENRLLVHFGLKVMAKSKRPGLLSLAAVSDVSMDKITTNNIGYRFGPRLNASGRLEHANTSLELLNSTDKQLAETLASELDKLNSNRRQEQDKIFHQAMQMAQVSTEEEVYIFVHPDWSHGIVGIVASKLVEELGKPVFVLQQMGDTLKGSARSLGDYHLADAITASSKFIEKGGGHAYAAGVTLNASKLKDFKASINRFFSEQNLQQKGLQIKDFDVELVDFSGISLDLVGLINQLEPYGEANPAPLLKINNTKLKSWRPVGVGGQHAKIQLEDKNGIVLDGIGFGLSNSLPEEGNIVSITTHIENNFLIIAQICS